MHLCPRQAGTLIHQYLAHQIVEQINHRWAPSLNQSYQLAILGFGCCVC